MMAKLVDLNLQPDTRTLRQFGFVAILGFGLLSFAAFREAGLFRFGLGEARIPVTYALAALGVVSALFSLVYPKANLPAFVGLSVLFFPLGIVMSYVLLAALFFVVIGPIALIIRAFGTDPMHRKYEPSTGSYWTTPEKRSTKDRYFRQF